MGRRFDLTPVIAGLWPELLTEEIVPNGEGDETKCVGCREFSVCSIRRRKTIVATEKVAKAVASTRLHERALLVSYRREGCWEGTEADSSVVSDAIQKYGIKSRSVKDAGKAELNLFPGCRQPLDNVLNAIERGYKTYREMTYVWVPGAQLLPTSQFQTFVDQMRPLMAEIDAARVQLAADYPSMVAQALKNRGVKANPQDYIDPSRIPDLYQVRLVYSKVPEAGDIRVDLPPEMIEEIKKGLQDENERNAAGLVQEALRRMRDALLAAKKNLSGSRIRPEWFNNLQSLLSTIDAYNFTDSDFLKKLVAQSEQVLEHPVDELRKDPDLARSKAAQVDDILGEILRPGK